MSVLVSGGSGGVSKSTIANLKESIEEVNTRVYGLRTEFESKGYNLDFNDLEETTFEAILANYPAGTQIQGYLYSTSALGSYGPAEVNGIYTLTIAETELGTKYGRLLFTTTSNNHRMFYTRVTSSGLDTWTEVQTAAADYVTECYYSETDTEWSYRKWANGAAECWKKLK